MLAGFTYEVHNDCINYSSITTITPYTQYLLHVALQVETVITLLKESLAPPLMYMLNTTVNSYTHWEGGWWACL